MTITRVLVAHESGARSFENRGPGKGLSQLAETLFEDGRRHPGEFETDRQGRTSSSGKGTNVYASEHDPRVHATEHFAKMLAQELGSALRAGGFQRLVLIAPPRFLGLLKAQLDPLVARVLLGTVSKDLPRASASELCKHIESLLAC